MSDIVEFRHLEYLAAIAARRNFSKAAEHVYRSQPAVSHQIKVLEADIGFPLLVRNGRDGVYPTPAGEVVLEWARTVLYERYEIFSVAKAIRDGAVPTLRLGFSSFVNAFLLDKFRLAYEDLFPKCEIQLFSGDTRNILQRLENENLDCAILPMPVEKDLWKVRQIAQSPLVVCMRSDDMLGSRAQLDIREVAARIKVFRDPELHPSAHSRLAEMFAEVGVPINLTSSAATPADMQLMVRQGYGLALMDQLCPLESGLISRPIAGLNWTSDTAFVTTKHGNHMAIPFIEKWLDKNEIGNIRKDSQMEPLRRPLQLRLIG